MRKVITKTCALIMTVSMLFGMIFMSDSATTYSMAATKTVETPESSKNALTKYKKISEINNNTILGTDFTYYQQCLASVDKGIHNKTTKYGLPTY